MLDDNKFTSQEVFSSLVNLKRLQHLNLQGNHISEVPYLQHMPPVQKPVASFLMAEGTNDDAVRMECFSEPQEDQREFLNRAKAVGGLVEYSEDFYPPFPQLQYLNLASNEVCFSSLKAVRETKLRPEYSNSSVFFTFLQIAEEEALLAVSLFPMLRELVIHSNPLTLQRSDNPPMLAWFLQEMLGIKIRGKMTAGNVKPQITLPRNPRKVNTKIPKVPLITTALCIENNSTVPSECKSDVMLPCFSQTSNERKEHIATANGSEVLEGENTEVPREMYQAEEPFFVTEVNDLLEPDSQEQTEIAEEMFEFVKKDTECPRKLRGYEALLGDYVVLDMPRPVGIQQTVKVLERTLNNLLVYRSSKANLDNLQRPYREQHKRIRDLPPVKPCKVKEEKVKEILTEIKEMRTINKVPLDKILKCKDKNRKQYEEALMLLKDMKTKYKTVHLKATEQAAHIESDYH
ncbi:X-ray radiation resistance-associated protein 1 [Brachyhypopomus gauderio]|uniref:X-ray radiation resistance-associated protein 1 n=1 Tax=Brachyhypopomus gauderio TaxID=698409 RepID=UPI0040412026